jgi:hypothetical protein
MVKWSVTASGRKRKTTKPKKRIAWVNIPE